MSADTGEATAPVVGPLPRPAPLRESVHEAISQMIIGGSLKPGQRLVEVDLARMLGVSRQPVREALQRLHNEGWVDLRPGYGAAVHVPADNDVDQLLTARAALESESARLAAENSSKADLAELDRLCKVGTSAAKSGEHDEAVQANSDLHRLITQMSNNQFLIDFAAQVDRRVRWYYRPIAPFRGLASWHEHTKIVKAIRQHDGALAASLMREHTEHTLAAFHETRRQQPADQAD